jgi:hypothetical protein
MDRCGRPLCLLLSACLLAASPGCRTAFEEAKDAAALLAPGMTQEEVRNELGEPSTQLESPEGPHWAYRCSGGPPTAVLVLLLVLALPLLPIILITRGTISGALTSNEPPFYIQIRFDAAGRVRTVSGPLRSPFPD